MKIALVHQPWSSVPPSPDDPIAVMIDQMARRLARSADVVCYGTRGRGQAQAEFLDGFEVRRVTARLDSLLKPLRMLDRIGILGRSRPFNASRLYQLQYIVNIAKDLRHQGCDLVHIHTFSQWVPILRRLNSRVRIVLHMHDSWLTRLAPATVRKRLVDADLILATSKPIAQGIREAFPEVAERCHAINSDMKDTPDQIDRGVEELVLLYKAHLPAPTPKQRFELPL